MHPWSIDQLHFSFMVYNLDSVKFTRLMPGHILLLFTSGYICLFVFWAVMTLVHLWNFENFCKYLNNHIF